MDETEKPKPMGQVIQIDGEIRTVVPVGPRNPVEPHSRSFRRRVGDCAAICRKGGEMVRGTVEEALNAMLDTEADRLCGAGKDERTESRKDTWAASYEWSLETKARSVKLKMPKLRRQSFEVAIIERYQRRESSVEEALMKMASHLAATRSRPMANGGRIRAPVRGHDQSAVG